MMAFVVGFSVLAILRVTSALLLNNSPSSRRIRNSLIAISVCSTCAGAYAQAPIAAYSFNEGAGSSAIDVSGNNNTLALQKGTAWDSGRDDFAVANAASPALNLAGRSLTLSAWIFPRSNNGWQMIVNKPYAASHSAPYFDWSLHRENSSGRIVAFFGCEGVQRTSNSAVPINTWTHVAVTYDGSSLRHYINGVLGRFASVPTAAAAKSSTAASTMCAFTTVSSRRTKFKTT
jgi:hypothetical protein